MDKRIIASAEEKAPPPDHDWLKLEDLAAVEMTSEDASHPIECALLPSRASGWGAGEPGRQTVRLLFAHLQRLRRIWLNFVEDATERTQECVLRWSPDHGQTFREIVRQQWNFGPEGATCETEDHRVELPAVTILGVKHHARYIWRECSRFFGRVATGLTHFRYRRFLRSSTYLA
jgi:hypothetical protein